PGIECNATSAEHISMSSELHVSCTQKENVTAIKMTVPQDVSSAVFHFGLKEEASPGNGIISVGCPIYIAFIGNNGDVFDSGVGLGFAFRQPRNNNERLQSCETNPG